MKADDQAPLADPATTTPEQSAADAAPLANSPLPVPETSPGPSAQPIVHDVDQERDLWDELLSQTPSWLGSMVVHLSLVLLLAMLTVTAVGDGGHDDLTIVSAPGGGEPGVEELDSQLLESPGQLEETSPADTPDLTQPAELAALSAPIGMLAPEALNGPTDPSLAGGEATGGGGALSLRLDSGTRARMVREQGGTPESEAAVKRALHWLAEHQNYDGSWTFQHQVSPHCHGSCSEPGFTPGKVAATALALLPFLGNGQTQRQGDYQKKVELALRFLVRSMQIRGGLGSLHEDGGQMYGHGMASIALCEAYGMTHDKFLAAPAQASINFIAEAQDPLGGGWRYLPRQPGDTSVVGWQLMALKSAQMAYLRVPPITMRKAGYFLDFVQGDRGAVYGYQRPEAGRPATTAIGLLCRMYLGWNHSQNPLQRGVRTLSILGPSTNETSLRDNMYYNYYATQVMHHWGGSEWRRWNEVMREHLIRTQSTRGHEAGSWYFEGNDQGSSAGGRLYCTAMAAMTLEVYYRHMPLYRPQSVTK